MLERLQFCTKKQMILAVILLGLLTVLLLFWEGALAAEEEHKPSPSSASSRPLVAHDNVDLTNNFVSADKIPPALSGEKVPSPPDQTTRPCWLSEQFTIEKPCTACSEFETKSKLVPACTKTGLREVVRCSVSGLYSRSCSRIPNLEKRKFLVFESLMLLVAILSYGLVKFRTSQLERSEAKRMEASLALG